MGELEWGGGDRRIMGKREKIFEIKCFFVYSIGIEDIL